MLKSLSNRMCAKSVGRWSLRDLCLARSFLFHSIFCSRWFVYLRCIQHFFQMNQNQKRIVCFCSCHSFAQIHFVVVVVAVMPVCMYMCMCGALSFEFPTPPLDIFKFSPFSRISFCHQHSNIGKWVWFSLVCLSEIESIRCLCCCCCRCRCRCMNIKIHRKRRTIFKIRNKTQLN